MALALLNFANSTGYTSVGVDRLEAEMSADRRTVQRGLAALVKAGHLEREDGRGVRGRGGWTAGTWLKVAATAAAVSVDNSAEGAAKPGRRGGRSGRKVAATAAAQTLLTNRTPAANAPGLEAEGYAANGETGSATADGDERRRPPSLAVLPIGPPAGPGGEVLRMLGELAEVPRADPRPVRDVVLAGLRQKFGLGAKREVSSNENSPPADTRGGSEDRVASAK